MNFSSLKRKIPPVLICVQDRLSAGCNTNLEFDEFNPLAPIPEVGLTKFEKTKPRLWVAKSQLAIKRGKEP
jgi:hypothetical protein